MNPDECLAEDMDRLELKIDDVLAERDALRAALKQTEQALVALLSAHPSATVDYVLGMQIVEARQASRKALAWSAQ